MQANPSKLLLVALVFSLITLMGFSSSHAGDAVKIGLNYPKTGPYATQGLVDQWQQFRGHHT